MIAGVTMVAGRPSEHRAFISTFTGVFDLRASANAVVAKTPRGDVAVTNPVTYRGMFGTAAPEVTDGARLAALRLAVADTSAAEDLLRAAHIAFAADTGQIVIGAGTAMGATIAFEQAGQPAR